MFQIFVLVSVFICISCLVGGVAILARVLHGRNQMEDRLASLTKNRGRGNAQEKRSLLVGTLEDSTSQLEAFLAKIFDIQGLLNLAGIKMPVGQFVGAALGLGAGLTIVFLYFAPYFLFAPFVFLSGVALPFFVAIFKKKKRLRRFSEQLAEAMDMMSRALRSGYSLPAGIQLVGQQMSEPLGPEFMRCFEEQKLGIPLEESIRKMVERIPNLDLQFFATAVILQRQTGGDLAEILDKISSLIRERFKIWGQIQALTGEGRLSGIVLLALPPMLFIVMMRLNYDYVMLLFNDSLGQMMLAGGIVMQILGAFVIKKIITIKV
ncbi:MAG TPA: type II secretion system F family protein [Pirellulaceae bacterium]|nr:type II secretion system F family protein [Pirellulaceae bacterium]HMO90555.1 type II secretion system F family protein [Pirellulaceae bacterium]HMP71226.1 type II secretion system F family protein [Pirellulaceae bacterium]